MKNAMNAGPAARDGEALSSFLDGELDADRCPSLLAALCTDTALRSEWTAFHVVGDALRSSEVAAGHSAGFCDRVAAAIALEPTVLAPAAARGGRVRRYVLPGLAVAAAAAVLSFVAVPLMQTPAPTLQQAAVPAPAVVATANPTAASLASGRAASTVANARAFQAYLLAHREMTSGAALPRATPYLRPAADSADGR